MATISETDVFVFAPSSACQRSTTAPRSRRQLLVSTKPESSNRRPPAPGSRKSLRSGDLGLKNGPSVWRTVGSSPSRQEGVGASSCVRTASVQDNSHPAASMPVLRRNRRRVGFDSLVMSVAKLLIDMSQESGCHDNKPHKPGLSVLAARPTTVTCSGAPSHCRSSAQDNAPRLSATAKPAKLLVSTSYGASHARADHIAGRRRASHDRRPIEITRYLAVNSCCRSVKIALAVAGHVKNPIDDCARGDRERTRNVIEVDA